MADKLKVGRPYSKWRISAYECKVDESGALKLQGNYVVGWYGPFTAKKLEVEILPKLSQYAEQGKRYPFLVTEHRLKDEAEVRLPEGLNRKLRAYDVKFEKRRRCTNIQHVAVVYSQTSFKLL